MCAFVYHNLCFEPVNQAVFGFPLCRLLWREFWKARTFSTAVKTVEFIYEVVIKTYVVEDGVVFWLNIFFYGCKSNLLVFETLVDTMWQFEALS